MTFEIFIYRGHTFAVKLQSSPAPKANAGKFAGLLWMLKQSLAGFIIQGLMGLCYGKILQEGEKQWRQRNAKSAIKK
jgi:hypothetical protein